MPTWPTSPTIQAVQIPSLVLPVLRSQYDQGYLSTRSRWTRTRRRFLIEYHGLTTDEYFLLQNFVIAEIFGAAIPFDWTYPYGTTITDAPNASPIKLTTQYTHGVQNYDRVLVAGVLGNTAANGVWTATEVDATSITLLGSAGNGAYGGGGVVSLTWENTMALDLASDTYDTGNKLLGPIVDNQGVISPTFMFLER